jgi:ubiquitin carboxyl-terminal hydrolase 34
MDFSFEKTNSAYMLFYEWCSRDGEQRGAKEDTSDPESTSPAPAVSPEPKSSSNSSPSLQQQQQQNCPTFELSKELEDWIWQDNMHFLKDKNIFEHTYFK